MPRSPENVVVVAASRAWRDYLDYGAYVCQPGRSFCTPFKYLAFYKENEILDLVPLVLDVIDQVEYARGRNPGRLGEMIDAMVSAGVQREKPLQKVFLLTVHDDPRTVRLARPISNDLRAKSGRRPAFVRKQVYVSLDELLEATCISQLNLIRMPASRKR